MSEPPVSASGSPSAGSTPGPCIVLVEDEPQIRRFLRARSRARATASTRRPPAKTACSRFPPASRTRSSSTWGCRTWMGSTSSASSGSGPRSRSSCCQRAGRSETRSPHSTRARMISKAVRRRRAAGPSPGSAAPRARARRESRRFSVGGLSVDQLRRQVVVDGKEVHLTPIEYRLLTTLCGTPGRS